jgi:hypothetical protein
MAVPPIDTIARRKKERRTGEISTAKRFQDTINAPDIQTLHALAKSIFYQIYQNQSNVIYKH